jgi:hypothetical protein
LGLQQLDQKQGESRDRITVGSLQPIELAAIWQPAETLLAGAAGHSGKTLVRLPKLHPMSKQCQRDHLTSAQRYQRAWKGVCSLVRNFTTLENLCPQKKPGQR